MADFKRDGLIEALLDAGADMAAPGFDLPLDLNLSVDAFDLSRNLKPVQRAIAMQRFTIAAGGAGNFSGIQLDALPHGFWILGCWSQSGITLHLSIVKQGTTPGGWATGIIWCLVGDSMGEQTDTQIVTGQATFLQSANQGNGSVSAIGNGIQFSNVFMPDYVFPMWVPGGCGVRIQTILANNGTDFSIVLQFPSQATGRFF